MSVPGSPRGSLSQTSCEPFSSRYVVEAITCNKQLAAAADCNIQKCYSANVT